MNLRGHIVCLLADLSDRGYLPEVLTLKGAEEP
jgi:hypothetical protein